MVTERRVKGRNKVKQKQKRNKKQEKNILFYCDTREEEKSG